MLARTGITKRSPSSCTDQELVHFVSSTSCRAPHIAEKLFACCIWSIAVYAHAMGASRACSDLLRSSSRDLASEVRFRGVVCVRVGCVCPKKCAWFGGQEPSLTLISKSQGRTTKPQNLDLGPPGRLRDLHRGSYSCNLWPLTTLQSEKTQRSDRLRGRRPISPREDGCRS